MGAQLKKGSSMSGNPGTYETLLNLFVSVAQGFYIEVELPCARLAYTGESY